MDLAPKPKRTRRRRAPVVRDLAAWKAQQQRAAVRTEERRALRKLRAELAAARADRATKSRKTRAHIRRARVRLAAAIKAFRKEWREYINVLVRKRRAAARAAWQVKLAKALAHPTRAVALRSAALRDYRRELAATRRYAATEKRAPAIRKAYEARSESDDYVRGNLPPELHSVWAKYKNKIATRAARKTRTEAFLEWCSENPDAVMRAQWGDGDQARLEKELREAEAAAREAKRAGATPRDLELLSAM